MGSTRNQQQQQHNHNPGISGLKNSPSGQWSPQLKVEPSNAGQGQYSVRRPKTVAVTDQKLYTRQNTEYRYRRQIPTPTLPGSLVIGLRKSVVAQVQVKNRHFFAQVVG